MKDNDCIFCKIASGEIPSICVYENDEFKVFLDLGPATKGHCLVIPKEHYKDIFDIPDDVLAKAHCVAKSVASILVEKLGATGVNIVQNNGSDAGQTMFHFHIHVIPRYEGDNAGFGWNEGELSDEIKAELIKKLGID